MLSKAVVAVLLFSPLFAADTVPPAPDMTVHEWGTFTSVAGQNGAPVAWAALTAPSDLPCFVYRLSAICVKCNATSTVRMETPVLYFYTQHPATVSVHVDLPSGVITEWYPKATGLPKETTYGNETAIDWNQIQVLPGATPAYPTDGSASHYYAARNTDSASLLVDGQQEKLLFYRGVAEKGVSMEAQVLADGRLEMRNTGSAPIPFAALFESRGGQSGYRVVRDLISPLTLDPPVLTADAATLHRDLAEALTAAGLFPKEAAAMIETWRDSWFEEGMRVFYILPREVVDSVLPLKITPAPATTVRVFVGRVEVLSHSIGQTLRAALASGDTAALARRGRFLEPFVEQLKNKGSLAISPAAQAFMTATRTQLVQNRPAACKETAPLPAGQR